MSKGDFIIKIEEKDLAVLREIVPRADRIAHRTQSEDKTWMDEMVKYFNDTISSRYTEKESEFLTKAKRSIAFNNSGTVTVLDISYNAFKGSRNLKNRDIYVSEYLFIVKKHKS